MIYSCFRSIPLIQGRHAFSAPFYFYFDQLLELIVLSSHQLHLCVFIILLCIAEYDVEIVSTLSCVQSSDTKNNYYILQQNKSLSIASIPYTLRICSVFTYLIRWRHSETNTTKYNHRNIGMLIALWFLW